MDEFYERFLKPIAFVAVVFACVVGLPSILLAQHESRNLSGTVTDNHHEPLKGAVVQAHNLYTRTVMSYITGRNGQYSFKRLDGDCDYKISATWHDQHSAEKNLSLFESHRTKIINLTIKPLKR